MSAENCRKLSLSCLKYINSAKISHKSATALYNELLTMRKNDFPKFNFIKDDVKIQINSYKDIVLYSDESIYYHKKHKYNNMIKYNEDSDERIPNYVVCGFISSVLIFAELTITDGHLAIVLYPSLMAGSYFLCKKYTET